MKGLSQTYINVSITIGLSIKKSSCTRFRSIYFKDLTTKEVRDFDEFGVQIFPMGDPKHVEADKVRWSFEGMTTHVDVVFGKHTFRMQRVTTRHALWAHKGQRQIVTQIGPDWFCINFTIDQIKPAGTDIFS